MNDQRAYVKTVLEENEAKIKLESEGEIIAFFDFEISMISAKIDLVNAGFHVSNYMPRELVITFESSPDL